MQKYDINHFDIFVFDCDGVLTDNRVWVNADGEEFVLFSRADSLAFDALKKLKKEALILSTEKNGVVAARGAKLGIEVFQGIKQKNHKLAEIISTKNLFLQRAVYVGNDLNDYYAMRLCGLSACPSDAHEKIAEIAKINLKCKGGQGILRELLEIHFGLDLLNILYDGTNKR